MHNVLGNPLSMDQYIQYGCFGVIAFLCFWMVKWGIPGALKTHKETVTKLVDEFRADSQECRKERMELAAEHAKERAMDREARHDQANKFQECVAELAGMFNASQTESKQNSNRG